MICKGDAKAYVNICKLGSRLSLKWIHFLKRCIYAVFRNHFSGFGYGFMWFGMIYFLSPVTTGCLNSYIGQIIWRRWAEFGFGSVITVVLTWVCIGWNRWHGTIRRHTLFSWAYGFPWRFGSLLPCMWGKTNNKLHETAVVKYQIQGFASCAHCSCAGGGVLLWSKRTSLCECQCGGKNRLDFTMSKPAKCLWVSLSWKWGNAKLNRWKGNPI